jgi:hypothetical protein
MSEYRSLPLGFAPTTLEAELGAPGRDLCSLFACPFARKVELLAWLRSEPVERNCDSGFVCLRSLGPDEDAREDVEAGMRAERCCALGEASGMSGKSSDGEGGSGSDVAGDGTDEWRDGKLIPSCHVRRRRLTTFH